MFSGDLFINSKQELSLSHQLLYLNAVCKAMPIHIASLVEVNLDQVFSHLISDKSLKVELDKGERLKFIYVVRDPRAILHSRLKENGCLSSDECSKAQIVCQRLAQDFKDLKFLKNFKINSETQIQVM